MVTFASLLSAATCVLSLAGTGPVIRVLSPDGRPLPDVGVVCVRGATGAGLTDEQGRFVLAPGCVEAECMRGGLLSGHVRIAGAEATCQLAAPVVVRGEVVGFDGAQRYHAALLSTDRRRAGQSAALARASADEPLRFRLEVPAGHYSLAVMREDMWSCKLELGALTPGEREVTVEWREPREIHGIVLDAEGARFGLVLLRVAYTDERDPGGVRCEMDLQALDVISDKDGRFLALVDPARPFRIVADDAWQPATVRIDP